jgi:hypothetical protein
LLSLSIKRNLMKFYFTLFAISILTSCQWLSEGDSGGVNDDLNAADSLNAFENQNSLASEPCNFSNPDISVFDIKLLDQKSSTDKIGSKYVLIDYGDDLPHLDFMTLDHKQTMTLYFQPGSSKNVFSEIEVRKADEKEILISLQTNVFETNSGIKIGMNRNKVLEILGNCYQKQEVKDSLSTLNYVILKPDNPEFFKEESYIQYSSEYSFVNDSLIRFRFGYIK